MSLLVIRVPGASLATRVARLTALYRLTAGGACPTATARDHGDLVSLPCGAAAVADRLSFIRTPPRPPGPPSVAGGLAMLRSFAVLVPLLLTAGLAIARA